VWTGAVVVRTGVLNDTVVDVATRQSGVDGPVALDTTLRMSAPEQTRYRSRCPSSWRSSPRTRTRRRVTHQGHGVRLDGRWIFFW
jgi:hypothetical protein